MKQKVQYSNAIVDNTEELKKRKTEIMNAHQRKMQDDVSSYLQWKRDMEERMEQKPLLLESGYYFILLFSYILIDNKFFITYDIFHYIYIIFFITYI